MTDRPRNTFADLSSNNPLPNIAGYAKTGHRVIALKATEALGYTWTEHARLADTAHTHHLTVLHYHFARPGSAIAQAEHFLAAVHGHTAPGDGLVVDCEVAGVNGRYVTAWLNRVHRAHPNLTLWVYGGPYFLRDNQIHPAHGAKLWLADYASKPAFIPPGWPHYDAWQFTQTGSVKGVAGRVDVSRLRVAPAKPKPPRKPTRKPTTDVWYRRWLRWINFWHRR